MPAIAPILDPASGLRFDLDGEIGRRLRAVTAQWLLPAPAANPAMLEMFAARDRLPLRELEAWSGEFAGKYLTSAAQILRLTGDGELRDHLARFVEQLLALQAEDGYLGCWPASCRFTNRAPNSRMEQVTWDTWGHYHAMLGLLCWYDCSGDHRALAASRRIADALCDRFLVPGAPRLVDSGWSETNLAPVHALYLLHRRGADERYLRLAQRWIDEFAAVGPDGAAIAGDYLCAGLAGTSFHRTPKPRWESLHPIMALAESYFATGDADHRAAFESLWWSMLEGDRHNNGGFTSGEAATGDPYHTGAIETCCTVAWMAMSVDMLRLTGNALVADELELSLLNSGLGLISPSGRWVTYDTPMDGSRLASAHSIVFQARPGSPELNCCSVNGPRVLGLLSEWALMRRSDGLALNWYGPGVMACVLSSGNQVVIRQEGDYPRDANVHLALSPARAERFVLALRIPGWSARTQVLVNGKLLANVAPGTYLDIDRVWSPGDKIEVAFDFSLRAWFHPQRSATASVYRGPVLLTYDQRLNDVPPADMPSLTGEVRLLPRDETRRLPPWMEFAATAVDGRPVRLCDFASAGDGGGVYRSWIAVDRSSPTLPFSRVDPRRAGAFTAMR